MSALRSRQRGLCRRLTIRNSACFGIIVETGVFFSEMLVFMRPVAGKVGVDLPAASWYNICKEFYFIKFCGCRRPVLRTVAVLTASQKCPCKQAFLLHGIIGHGRGCPRWQTGHSITLIRDCTFTYCVPEFREHGITSNRTCTFTHHVPENGAEPRFPTQARHCAMR